MVFLGEEATFDRLEKAMHFDGSIGSTRAYIAVDMGETNSN